MRTVFRILAALAVAAAPLPAQAKWFEARTDHFVIDVDSDEAQAGEYATRLERFDLALRRLYGVADDPDRRSNPLRIIALHPEMFFRVCNCSAVLGYYQAGAGGSTIFTAYMPGIDAKSKPGQMTPQSILLHEYGHHFMYSNFPRAYPMWYSEGFAEFNANVVFNADGSILLGYPANYRYYAIRNDSVQLSVNDLFQPSPDVLRSWAVDMIYGRGWLLTHYLTLDPHRKGQLAAYLDALNKGKSSLDAARSAFGDLPTLYKEILAYARAPHLAPPLRIPPPGKPVKVTVTALSEGAAAMMEVHARSTNGVDAKQAKDVVKDAEKIAGKYPTDRSALLWLAEAEFDADKLDAADAAADRVLAVAADDIGALLYKGRVAVRRAFLAKSTDPLTWRAARAWYAKANHVDPNASMPLLLYYQSFLAAKVAPNASAITGLKRAEVLAPEDKTIRALLARQMLIDGDAASAHQLLEPLAYAPHGKADNPARKVIDLLDAGKLDEARKAIDPQTGDDDTTRKAGKD